MFTKLKVKKYLKTKEVFSVFDNVLSFYTTLYMKEVFRFWGLKQISISITWENEIPVVLSLSSTFEAHPFNWNLNETECIWQIDDACNKVPMNSFNDIHHLFDFMRDQLPQEKKEID